jgi:hypothetical protein
MMVIKRLPSPHNKAGAERMAPYLCLVPSQRIYMIYFRIISETFAVKSRNFIPVWHFERASGNHPTPQWHK